MSANFRRILEFLEAELAWLTASSSSVAMSYLRSDTRQLVAGIERETQDELIPGKMQCNIAMFRLLCTKIVFGEAIHANQSKAGDVQSLLATANIFC